MVFFNGYKYLGDEHTTARLHDYTSGRGGEGATGRGNV